MKAKYPITLQQDRSDCGVACLLSVINYYGGNNTLENIRRLSGTNPSGTTLLGLYQAANQLGFSGEGCKADIETLVNQDQPCILHITLQNNLHHYIIFYGVNLKDKKIIIGDPAKGIEYITRETLNNLWQSKTCLTLTPNDNFVKESDYKKAKHKWIINLIRDDAPLLGIGAALGIAISVLGLSMAIFSQRLIDNILPSKNVFKLNLYIVLLFILMIGKECLLRLRQHFLIRQTKGFNIRIIDFFFSHLLQLPKPFFDTRKIGELTARLNDTSRIQRVISQLASNTAIDILMVIVSITVVFTYSGVIGFVCITIIPIFYFLIYKHNKNIMQGQRDIMSSYAYTEANYISTLQGIDPIKNHNKQRLYTTTNNTIYQTFQNKIYSLSIIQIRLSFLVNCFSVLFLVGILFYGGHQVLNGYFKAGQLIALLSMCGALLPSVANLALITIPLNEAKIAFDRMFEFTAIDPEKDNGINSIEQFDSLKIENLFFRFAGRSLLLKNISFEVSKGQIIALMGENGCGKSTIIQIIQKHYIQEQGNIIVNQNMQLKNISFTSWRHLCAVVPQNIHIFNGSVLENIAFENAINKADNVISFLKENGFMPFLDALPQSFLTIVGDEGINLSGGQKQIIAIARALYTNPQLLILDEATASMDRESEQFVLNLLKRMQTKMGIIFVTHRLHILKSLCQQIYIIRNGEIEQFGTHHQLIQETNLYSNYWQDLN